MPSFELQLTLLATVTVSGDTLKAARTKLRAAIDGHEANLGMIDDQPIVTTVEIEGEIDCDDEGT